MQGMLDYLLFAVTVLVLAAAHLRDQRHADHLATIVGAHEEDRYAWVRERQELLTRVQAPHLIPVPLPQGKDPAEPGTDVEQDDFDRQGEILLADPTVA